MVRGGKEKRSAASWFGAELEETDLPLQMRKCHLSQQNRQGFPRRVPLNEYETLMSFDLADERISSVFPFKEKVPTMT